MSPAAIISKYPPVAVRTLKPTTRPRVLITGFSAFPGMTDNPSERLVRAIGDLAPFAHVINVRAAILKTEYLSLPHSLDALISDHHPDICLHFGVSRKAAGLVLERRASFLTLPDRPDAAGHIPPARPDTPSDLSSPLPIDAIRRRLADNGIIAACSDDAGAYVCNYLYRLSLEKARSCRFSCLFAHIPDIGEKDEAAWLDLWRGVDIILAEMIAGHIKA